MKEDMTMRNTNWTIYKASDHDFVSTLIVNNPTVFALLLESLYNEYNQDLIINFDDHTITIYDDYIE